MQSTYKSAFFNPSFDVLGKSLKPLSLGHLYILYASDNNFVLGNDTDFEDIISLIFICSNDYLKTKRLIETGLYKNEVEKWGRDCDLLNVGFEESKKDIDTYLSYYLQAPETWESNTNGSTIGSHWLVSLITSLMEYLNIPEDVLLNMPVSKALSYYITLQEQKGGKKVISDDELDILDKFEDNE